MSSKVPSLSANSTSPTSRSKRKRMADSTSGAVLPADDQATSRDASAEETADPDHSAAYDETFKPPPKPLAQEVMHNPPLKRPRRHEKPSKERMEGVEISPSSSSMSEADEAEDDDDDLAEGGDQKMLNAMKLENAGKGAPIPPPEIKLENLVPKGYHMNPVPEDRPVRVYADGVFDLFHLGHMRALEQAKKALPNTYLLVGIPNDGETHKRKGLTVLSDKERAESLRHCKWVDEVIEDAPWIVTPAFLEEHQIDYVAHDDEPYAGGEGEDDIYKPCKQAGKFLVTQRTQGISTTYIITKIVRDYEKYISRQLKRGTPRQELNVSWLKKNELDLKRHIGDMRESIKNNWSTTGRELRNEIQAFWAGQQQQQRDYTMYGQGDRLMAPSPLRSASNPNLKDLALERPASPSLFGGGGGNDFAAGYTLGLLGGVKSWMMRGRTGSGSARGSEANSDDETGGLDSPRDEKKDAMDTKV